MPRLAPDARRTAILQAATALFLENGYSGTSLAMIMERSGGSRREVYRHFGDKAAMFKTVMTALFAQAPAAFSSIDLSKTPETVLNEIGLMLLSGLVDTAAATGASRHLLSDAIMFPEIGKLVFESGPQQMRGPLEEYLREMTSKGELMVTDARGAAAIFLQMVVGQYQQQSLADPDFAPPRAELADHVVQAVKIFLFGVTVSGRVPPTQ
ncbi:MAG: TetR/AcrR family transcriptional regulator [Paracoccaceae bacterium]